MKNNKEGLIKKIKAFCHRYRDIIYLVLPFVCLDFTLQLIGSEIFYFPLFFLMPALFTAIWLFLILTICLNLNRKAAIIFYSIMLFLAFIIFLTNGVYYSTTNNFFDFSLLGLASEGSAYFLDAILNTKILIYVSALVFGFLSYNAFKYLPDNKKTDFQKIGIGFIYFFIIHACLPILYGPSNKTLTWNTWQNAQNVYLRFNDSNKSFTITGLYEYTFRNFYINFVKAQEPENDTELDFLNEAYSNIEAAPINAYTGLFKDNNVIFLQLEGIDNWLLTEETMPNLYAMQENSINFTNHFSFYNGGGSTFNSEFAVNTGFTTPITYNRNAYTFNRNDFSYSLANLFKNEKYDVNAFHMNSREYYSRGINYENWGYDNYYGLKDLELYLSDKYQLDTELILNENFYNLMFTQENKFVHYLITYSNHMPFTTKYGVCRQLLNQDLDEGKITKQELNDITEEGCIRRQARETDDMIGLLLQALEDNNLSENTVLVIFTDHYLYTVSDEEILAQYKETSNNLINHTPFLIYKKNLKRVNVTDVTSQLDILPTILNLFGINYVKDYYMGSDALDGKYEGLVYFADYSWYDGTCYVDNGEVKNKCELDKETLEEKNNLVDYLIKKNDFTLKYDYFKKMKEKIEGVEEKDNY